MNYEELIAAALKGRSVNSMAKAWGIPQPTLDAYVKGKTIPDFDTALKMTKEAGADEKEAFEALAEKARSNRAAKFRLQSGFVQIEVLLSIATLGLYPLSILCQITTPSGQTIYIVYTIGLRPSFKVTTLHTSTNRMAS